MKKFFKKHGRIFFAFNTAVLIVLVVRMFCFLDVKTSIIVLLAAFSLCEFITDFYFLKSWAMKKKDDWKNRKLNKQKKAYDSEIKKLKKEIFISKAEKNALTEKTEFYLKSQYRSEEEKNKITNDFIERVSTLDFTIDTCKTSLELKEVELERFNREIMIEQAAQRIRSLALFGFRGTGRTYNREALLESVQIHDAIEDGHIAVSVQQRMRDMMDGIITVDTTNEGFVIRDGHHRIHALTELRRNHSGDLDFTFESHDGYPDPQD